MSVPSCNPGGRCICVSLGDHCRKSYGQAADTPLPLLIWCPSCKARHVDEGEFAAKPHHTHACQRCGLVWRPALVNTVGVRWLPGFGP